MTAARPDDTAGERRYTVDKMAALQPVDFVGAENYAYEVVTALVAAVREAEAQRDEATKERDAALAAAGGPLYREWSQQWVDQVCHYRNLSIALGAKPQDMLDGWDRKLCERGIEDDNDYAQKNEARETWEELEAAETALREAEARAERAETALREIKPLVTGQLPTPIPLEMTYRCVTIADIIDATLAAVSGEAPTVLDADTPEEAGA